MSPTSTAAPPLAGPDAGLVKLLFAGGIPGFPQAHRFAMRLWGDHPTPFYVLECEDLIGLRFVVMSPGLFFPWYQPRFGAEVYLSLDAEGPDDIFVLAILTLHSRPEDTTANLLGPVVVNARTGHAVQAVLNGSGYEARTPLAGRR